MKLASFMSAHGESFGIVDGEDILDCGAVWPEFPDLKSAIAKGAYEHFLRAASAAPRLDLKSVSFLPVIPNPGKILCVGLNYEMHRQETGRPEVKHPTIFTRFADSQTAHNAPMLMPAESHKFDFEGELVVVIGKGGRRIARDNAFAHIAGYAIYNEGSVRDFQAHTMQFTPGKNFPKTGAFGPWMVTADEFTPGRQRIQTRLNGEIMQDAQLDQMIFSIPDIVAYCSIFTPLSAGDVIVTGTPGGVGAKRTPPVWLRPGDRVEVEIEGIGVLTNSVVQESA